MTRGFYNLTSGMLTQTRVLNAVSNNISNTATAGYKKDLLATSTFRDILTYRTGNIDKSRPVSLGGSQSMIRTADELITIYTQGAIEPTGRTFDFGIEGQGFFQIQTPDGMVYTRNGSFTLDDEGYLYLQGVGRVMGTNGPMRLGTDKFNADREGYLTLDATGAAAGRILIADFEDYDALSKYGEGMFTTDAAPALNPPDTLIAWKSLERSNVNVMDEMIDMITAQRSLQSAAQILMIHDQINSKTVNDIARVI